MIWLRSLLFIVLFQFLTALTCIALVPALILPRRFLLAGVTFYLRVVAFVEKYLLGLTFEVRGREYMPKDGSYFVAAKHQSTYETLKLFYLFHDPAVILKKELMRIPLWGWHAWKLDFIAIDRKNRESAMASIIEGARHIKEQGRPIVIFPQGTRVRADQTPADKPYKGGIAKMYAATDLPILPMAVNTGLFWPRGSIRKYPGKVIFEFLPPIEPGLPEKKVMQALEERIENASIRLMHEGKRGNKYLEKTVIPPLPDTAAE